jgi:aspartyl-tRNA(Asn)/glutamyl-tRNA(Gln) amidotransferase subunit A
MTDFHDLTIKKFHEGLLAKEFSAREVAESYFARIKKTDIDINAYLSTAEPQALKAADAADALVSEASSRGALDTIPALAGVPLAIKDNILIKGLPATAASKILENYLASYDAGVTQKLKAAHAVFLGKTNLDEFAMGSSTENSGFRPTHNPHDTERVPGGSSGGSAAAVAADMAVAALGSDTGGSIRQPAGFCGIVGFKPTYGAVSRSGLIAMASSLDQIGPLTKTVEDAAILYKTIAGRDPLDATSTNEGALAASTIEKLPPLDEVKKLTIGLPEEYFVDGLSSEVAEGVQGAIDKFKKLGFNFKKISLPHTKYALSCYYIVMPAEVSSNLARFDGIRYARMPGVGETGSTNANAVAVRGEKLLDIYLKQRGMGFGAEVKRRAFLGTFVLSSGYYDAYYEKAQRVRALITQDFTEAFKEVDVILTPVTPSTAFKIGTKTSDPLSMYLEDIFTIPVNLAGLPGISIPTEKYPLGGTKLPVGFQLIGKKWHEADILNIGRHYERE